MERQRPYHIAHGAAVTLTAMIHQLFVDCNVADDPLIKKIAAKLGLIPTVISNHSLLYGNLKMQSDPWESGKQHLLLTRQNGPFLKKCPGTKEYLCCDYNILHIGSYCTMDCSYCILQAYFHPPLLQFFVNHDDLFSELETVMGQSSAKRIGTGEFTDSLIWEAFSGLTTRLVELFAAQQHSVLELKTKTARVEFLSNLNHNKKTILAWSLNTPRIIANQERGTASLDARLRAAAQCQSWGYPLAFHFDPIILYPGCEDEYHQVIEDLFALIRAENIVWISLGTLRFMPSLKSIIQRRFPNSVIVYNEFISGLDGKMRYFKPMRVAIYRRMMQWIKNYAPDTTVYLCMEDETVWKQGMGFSPESKNGLPAMLDDSMRRQCGCI